MRKIITGGIAVTLGVSTALAAGAFAGGNGAQRSALGPQTSGSAGNCQSGGSGGNGFAIVNGPGKPGAIKFVNGEVHLVNGTANTTYTIGLARKNGDPCQPVGSLTTNGQGIGNGHINGMGTAGNYFVALLDSSGNEAFASGNVVIN